MDLRELKKYIRRAEFNRTEPQILIELIKKAIERGNILGSELKKIRHEANKLSKILLKENIIEEIKVNNLDYFLKSFYVGIDGSNRIVRIREGEYCSMVSAVIAKFPRGLKGKVEVKFGDIELLKITDPTGENVKRKTEILMLEYETKALIHFVRRELMPSNRCYILLDGPIVDPPRPVKDTEYVRRRVKAIIEGINKGALVSGYVKRIQGNLFKKYVEKVLNNPLPSSFISDRDLILSTMLILNSTSEDNTIFYTTPKELPIQGNDPLSSAYKQYKDHNVHIYYSYSMLGPDRAPFRISLAFKDEPSNSMLKSTFREALKAIVAITPPGIKYPLPILVAHDKARIRKGAAEVIVFEIMTRAIVPDGDPILTRLKYLLWS